MDFNNLGLQNCYKFDNNYADSCGIITGVPTAGVSFDTGKLGSAARFNGVAGTKVSLSNIVCRSFKTGISLSCWFNADTLAGATRFPFFIAKSTDEETGNIFLLGITRGAPRRLRFGVTTKSSGYSEIFGTTTINTGTWYFALATYDVNTTVMNLYLGGSGLENSLTISGPPGLDVRLLGSVTSGLSHAAPAGNNRILLFAAGNENPSATTATSVTYGGQAMTLVNQRTVSAFFVNYISLWRLNDAGISAAAGSNFVVNWSGGRSEEIYHSAFYANVDQTTPIGYNNTNANTSSITISTTSTTPNDGNMMVMNVVSGSVTGWASTSFITLAIETVGSDFAQAWAYELGANATITPTFTGNGVQNRQAAICVELLKVGGGNGTENILENNNIETVIGGISSGAATPNGVPTLNGRIDQAIIWNKVLTASDFNAMYNGGAGEQCPEILFRFGRRPEIQQQVLNTTETVADLGINAGPFTICCWCYRKGTGDGGLFYAGQALSALGVSFSGNIITLYSRSGVSSFVSSTPLETWVHIAATSDGPNSYLYINGQQVIGGAIAGGIGGYPFSIGVDKQNVADPKYFTGTISDFRIYTRELNQKELLTIYNTLGKDNIRFGLIRQYLTNREIIKYTNPSLPGSPIALTSQSSGSNTWNHTLPAGSNRVLLVAISNESVAPLPPETVSGATVTYGGILMNKIKSFTDNNTNRFQQAEFWIMTEDNINRIGSNTIQVNWDIPGNINFQVNLSVFFENVAQHGVAKYSLTNSFNGVSNRLDLLGAYGDANDVIVALYTSAQADISPALIGYNGYTKIIELTQGALGGDSMVSGLFRKTIINTGNPTDYPDIENILITSSSVDRQIILAIALSPPQENIISTAQDKNIIKNGNKIRYTEDVLRIL